jgi:hypothetical protein
MANTDEPAQELQFLKIVRNRVRRLILDGYPAGSKLLSTSSRSGFPETPLVPLLGRLNYWGRLKPFRQRTIVQASQGGEKAMLVVCMTELGDFQSEHQSGFILACQLGAADPE